MADPPRDLITPVNAARYARGVLQRAYDISADGQRFLFTREIYPPTTAEVDRVHIVLNWFGELTERPPVP